MAAKAEPDTELAEGKDSTVEPAAPSLESEDATPAPTETETRSRKATSPAKGKKEREKKKAAVEAETEVEPTTKKSDEAGALLLEADDADSRPKKPTSPPKGKKEREKKKVAEKAEVKPVRERSRRQAEQRSRKGAKELSPVGDDRGDDPPSNSFGPPPSKGPTPAVTEKKPADPFEIPLPPPSDIPSMPEDEEDDDYDDTVPLLSELTQRELKLYEMSPHLIEHSYTKNPEDEEIDRKQQQLAGSASPPSHPGSPTQPTRKRGRSLTLEHQEAATETAKSPSPRRRQRRKNRLSESDGQGDKSAALIVGQS